jgi:hypothetical protein
MLGSVLVPLLVLPGRLAIQFILHNPHLEDEVVEDYPNDDGSKEIEQVYSDVLLVFIWVLASLQEHDPVNHPHDHAAGVPK